MVTFAGRLERQERQRSRFGPGEGVIDPGPAGEVGVQGERAVGSAREVIALVGEQECDRALALRRRTPAGRARREWRPQSDCRPRDGAATGSPARRRPAGERSPRPRYSSHPVAVLPAKHRRGARRAPARPSPRRSSRSHPGGRASCRPRASAARAWRCSSSTSPFIVASDMAAFELHSSSEYDASRCGTIAAA